MYWTIVPMGHLAFTMSGCTCCMYVYAVQLAITALI